MDLHGCAACGATSVDWADALIAEDGTMARRYHGSCAACGAEREFVFALPERPTPPAPGAYVTFGAAGEVSQLFDAGEWLEIADLLTLAASVGEAPEEEARESVTIAVACYDEVLKFLPDDADEVPEAAFWSEAGRGLRRRSPDRFRRADLVARRFDLAGRR
jgi:hypothetical protein